MDYTEHFEKIIDALHHLGDTAKQTPKALETVGRRQEAALSKILGKAHNAAHRVVSTSGANAHVAAAAQSMRALSGSADDLAGAFRRTVERVWGGAMIAELVHSGMRLTRTFRQFNDIGQDFGGSMFAMAKAAGDAALPLDQFYRMVQRNSAATAALAYNGNNGAVALGQLQKSVRENIKDHGYYGLSIEQISDITSDYTETLRQQNFTAHADRNAMARDIADFSKEISEFSAVAGKSREEIAKVTNEALRDSSIAARMAITGDKRLEKNLTDATAFAAALPGEAGKQLSLAITQTIGRGSGVLSDFFMNTLSKSGAVNLLAPIETYVAEIHKGHVSDAQRWQFVQQLQAEFRKALPGLHAQIMAGNASASELVNSMTGVLSITKENLKASQVQADNRKGITNFFKSLDARLTEVGGAFFSGLNGALESWEASLGADGTETVMKDLQAEFAAVGKAIGGTIPYLLGFARIIGKAVGVVDSVFSVLGNLGPGFAALGHALTGLTVMIAGLALKHRLSAGIDRLAGHLGRKVTIDTPEATMHVGVAKMLGAADRPLGGSLGKVGTELMEVHANVCKVNCGAGGRGGGSSFERPGKSAGAKGTTEEGHAGPRRARSGALGGRIAEAETSVARVGAKSILRGGAHLLTRGVIGAVLGAAGDMAINAAMTKPDGSHRHGQDALSGMLDYGSVGAGIGMMFGPLGAAVGATAGGLLGLALNAKDAMAGLHDVTHSLFGTAAAAAAAATATNAHAAASTDNAGAQSVLGSQLSAAAKAHAQLATDAHLSNLLGQSDVAQPGLSTAEINAEDTATLQRQTEQLERAMALIKTENAGAFDDNKSVKLLAQLVKLQEQYAPLHAALLSRTAKAAQDSSDSMAGMLYQQSYGGT